MSLLGLLILPPAFSQQPNLLVDGAHIEMAGVVGMEARGNHAFVVIKPGRSYTALFEGTYRRVVREIGLSLEGQTLTSLAGQKVVVSGTIQLEPASPYYLNGTLIVADSIRLADGSLLRPKPYSNVGVPASIMQFHSQVTFAPRYSRRWTYKTWDTNGTPLDNTKTYISCSLNGAGDVMNCYCPAGFSFSATGNITKGLFTKTAEPQKDFDFAQFSIADPVRNAVTEAVECTRQPHH